MRFWALLFALIMTHIAAAEDARDLPHPAVYGKHYGYTFEVAEEKNKRDIELVMIDQPVDLRPRGNSQLVNEKLSKEFQEQYKYRFGQTQAEQVINSPARTDEYTVYTGQNVTLQDYQMYQRQFAEYMGRRLTEYHVDNWVKNDPGLRPVYELKDRVSNLNVEMKKGYKLNWRYNFAGPSMDASVENPYDVLFKVRVEMTGIISSPAETIYTLGYPLSPRLRVEGLWRQVDGLYQVVFTRQMSRQIGVSLTGSMDRRPEGPTVQQDLVLVGFSWSE
ncbi:MAG: hypothetical protein KF799_04020 [Bdellovibrionales bacterium]|nr:hypothetical protein [Bdellovibrionales bacterium]